MTVKVVRKKTEAGQNFEKLLAELESTKKIGKVGWYKNTLYPDGTPVAKVAAIQEFGDETSNIPPRPFMRPTIANKKNDWREIAYRSARAAVKNGGGAISILERVALRAAGDVRRAISELSSPILQESTIIARLLKKGRKRDDEGKLVRKKFKRGAVTQSLTKPLVDTKIMINSLSGSVEEP